MAARRPSTSVASNRSRSVTILSSKLSPSYGRGVVTIAEADFDFTSSTEVLQKLQVAFSRPSYMPPMLPAAAIQLVQLSQKPEVTFAEMRRLIEREPILAASVLRTARSAAYNATGAVRTLEEAMVRLGLRTLADFFLEAAMKLKVFRAVGYEAPMIALSKHSSVVAHLSRHIARRTSLFDEYSFLCGLLHDIGLGAGLIILSSHSKKRAAPPFVEIWDAVRDTHEIASETICRKWGLPPDVALITGHHHRCVVGGQVHPVAAVVAVADWAAGELGCGIDELTDPPSAAVLKPLNLTPRDLVKLLDECRRVMELLIGP